MTGRSIGELAALAEAFGGVTVTIATPFDPVTLDVDLDGLARNLRFLACSGVPVIVPCGNTGEYHSLTVEETVAITAATVREVAGKAAVVMGVGGDVRTAVAMTRFAEEAGARGVLVHEPVHTFASDEGLYRYYRQICDTAAIGVAIYKRTPRIRDDLLARVAEDCPNVVAIKYAWNDVAAFVRLTTRVPSRVTCACGSAERWALAFAAAGTTGFTSGIANFAPELPLRFREALVADPPAARAMWDNLAALEEVRARQDAGLNVPVVKYAMELLGHAAGPPRPPLAPLDERARADVRQILRQWNLPLAEGALSA